jgi:hypothetical protein
MAWRTVPRYIATVAVLFGLVDLARSQSASNPAVTDKERRAQPLIWRRTRASFAHGAFIPIRVPSPLPNSCSRSALRTTARSTSSWVLKNSCRMLAFPSTNTSCRTRLCSSKPEPLMFGSATGKAMYTREGWYSFLQTLGSA